MDRGLEDVGPHWSRRGPPFVDRIMDYYPVYHQTNL